MFVLFAFDDVHPLGGAADAVGVYETVEQAQRAADQPWGHRRPIEHDNCEIWAVYPGRLRPVAERSGGRWVEVPDGADRTPSEPSRDATGDLGFTPIGDPGFRPLA